MWIEQGDNLIDGVEWRFFLQGGTSTAFVDPNPDPSWINEKV